MKGVSTVILAATLVGAVYLYSATPGPSLAVRVLKIDEPVEDVDQCLQIYGQKVKADFHRTSAGEDVGGIRTGRLASPPGATYVSAARRLKVSLQTTDEQNALVIRSAAPLSSAELAIFRWCAEQGSRVPYDWNRVIRPER